MGRSRMIFLTVLQVFLNFYSNIVGNNAVEPGEWLREGIIAENHFWHDALDVFEDTLKLPVDADPLVHVNFPFLSKDIREEILDLFEQCKSKSISETYHYVGPQRFFNQVIVEWKYLHDKEQLGKNLAALKGEIDDLILRYDGYDDGKEKQFNYSSNYEKIREADSDFGYQNVPILYRVKLHILKLTLPTFYPKEREIINQRVKADIDEYLYNRTEIGKLSDHDEVTKLNEANGLRFALNITIVLNRVTRILESRFHLVASNDNYEYPLIGKYREKPLILEAFTYPDVLGFARSLHPSVQEMIEEVYKLLRNHIGNAGYLHIIQIQIQTLLRNYFEKGITLEDVARSLNDIITELGGKQLSILPMRDDENEAVDVKPESADTLQFEIPKKDVKLPSDRRRL